MPTTPQEIHAGRAARFALGPFETNCYVLRAAGDAQSCWIIDAGFAPEPMIGHIQKEGLTPELIVLTHAHADHIAGLDLLRETFPGVPVALHGAESHWLADADLNLSNNFGMPMTFQAAEQSLADGDTLTLASEQWTVMHTPGHSPGSVSLYNAKSAICFAGDTLFHGSIGRFDFPTSNGEHLFSAIRERLYTLPDDTLVLPGHGPATDIGREKRTNPFVRPE